MKQSREIMQDIEDKGDIRTPTSAELIKDGFLNISRVIARRKDLSAGTKLVWGAILGHAWNDKDKSFPGRKCLAEETGLSLKTVTNALKQLQGENDSKDVFLTVIHRGHGLNNIYNILYRMDKEKAEYSVSKMRIKKGRNYTSKKSKSQNM